MSTVRPPHSEASHAIHRQVASTTILLRVVCGFHNVGAWILGRNMTGDPFGLERFIEAQEASYSIALAEVQNGRKRSHWMWVILPQLRGLGSSEMAHKFGISGTGEAAAYMAH